MNRWLNMGTNLFPVWVLAGGVLALLHPPWFTWVVGQRAGDIRQSGGVLLAAVFLLHTGGFALGHTFARLLGYDEWIRRTIAIEVGMQNSGLGVVLAQRNFPALPATATPCAISATFHSVIGSVLAGIWRLRPVEPVRRADGRN